MSAQAYRRYARPRVRKIHAPDVASCLKTEAHQPALLTIGSGTIDYVDPASDVPAEFRSQLGDQFDERYEASADDEGAPIPEFDYPNPGAVLRSPWFVCVKTHALVQIGRRRSILRHEINLARALKQKLPAMQPMR